MVYKGRDHSNLLGVKSSWGTQENKKYTNSSTQALSLILRFPLIICPLVDSQQLKA